MIPAHNGNARASVVNRTHRVVREQALMLRAQKEKSRSLWVPLAISSLLVPVVCYAVWALLDEYDLTANGVPDASDQLMVFLLWFIPLSALALGIAWMRRSRMSNEVSS